MSFSCPGVDDLGRSLTATVVHDLDCCERFAKLGPAEQARLGLREPGAPAARGPRAELPRPPLPQIIDVAGLAAVVAALQKRAAEFPDETPPGAIVWVQYGPEHSEADVQALIELGRPYNLVVGSSRCRHANTEGDR